MSRTLNCYPPHPSWDKLKAALFGAFSGVGADVELARRLYFFVRQAGLANVQFRRSIVGVRSTDPMVDYLPSTVELSTRNRAQARIIIRARVPGGAGRVSRALATARHSVHAVHGGSGLGPKSLRKIGSWSVHAIAALLFPLAVMSGD